MIARVRSLFVAVILLVPLTVTTGANVASASGSSAPTVTTVIGLAQTCESTGETCMPMSTAQSFISSSPLTVVFTLDAVHCSNVAVKLFVDGAASVTTPFSDPGKNTEKAVVPWPNDGKAHVLGYEGFGEVGGCNEGNLITWSGSLSVTYVPVKSAALSVSVKLARSTIAQGSQVEATATVGASGGSVSSITLGDGLTSSDDTIASVAPVSPGGFSLDDGSSKKITFTVNAVAVGSVQLTLNASGTTSSGANVQASGQATLNVKELGIVVNTTSDEKIDEKALSPDSGSPFCAIDAAAADPKCSLRAAIQLVNKLGGTQTITFDIPGGGIPTIAPASTLPSITASVTLDASTQEGGWVELSGASAGSGDGLTLDGANSTVRGFVINGFASGAGISIEKGIGDLIVGDRIGTDPTGMKAVPNKDGVLVGASKATVGGVTGTSAGACTGDCNLISGNSSAQIDTTDVSGTGGGISFGALKIQGDWIGMNSSGQSALSASSEANGIVLAHQNGEAEISNGDSVVIGGDASRPGLAPGNVVAAPHFALSVVGFETNLVADGPAVRILGNLVGLTVDGEHASGTGDYGILVNRSDADVGDGTAQGANVVSGFSKFGISAEGSDINFNFIGTNVTGISAVGNYVGLAGAAHAIDNNVISGNYIGVGGANVYLLCGNLVGLTPNGLAALPNKIGIQATNVFVGANLLNPEAACPSTPSDVISGNTEAGIEGAGDGNVLLDLWLRGVYLGTNVAGTGAVPNGVGIKAGESGGSDPSLVDEFVDQLDDLWSKQHVPLASSIEAQPIVEIGGPSAALSGTCTFPCNIIAGNTGPGIRLDFSHSIESKTSFIDGSFFGVSSSGEALPNGGPDITISGVGEANPLRIGGEATEGDVFRASGFPALSVTGANAESSAPPVSFLGNQFIEDSQTPPIVGPTHPGAPKLEKIDSDGPTLHLQGYVFRPERVEFYSSSSCGGARYPADYVAVSDTGEFNVAVPLKDFGGRPYISAIGTDTSSNTSSTFSKKCVLIPS